MIGVFETVKIQVYQELKRISRENWNWEGVRQGGINSHKILLLESWCPVSMQTPLHHSVVKKDRVVKNPTTDQNPHWNSSVQIASVLIPTAKKE